MIFLHNICTFLFCDIVTRFCFVILKEICYFISDSKGTVVRHSTATEPESTLWSQHTLTFRKSSSCSGITSGLCATSKMNRPLYWTGQSGTGNSVGGHWSLGYSSILWLHPELWSIFNLVLQNPDVMEIVCPFVEMVERRRCTSTQDQDTLVPGNYNAYLCENSHFCTVTWIS